MLAKSRLPYVILIALALTLVQVWPGDEPVAEAQAGGSRTIKPVITEIIPADRQLTVNWSYDGDSSSEVESWHIAYTRVDDGVVSQRQSTSDGTGNARSFVLNVIIYPNRYDATRVQRFENGETYSVKVVPIFKYQHHYGTVFDGIYSDPVEATVGGPEPAKPTGLKLTQSETSGDITATWNAAENATRYRVRWRDAGSRLGEPVYVTGTQYTVSLAKYGDWTIRVEACNEIYCGKPTSKVLTTQHPWTPSLSYFRQVHPGKTHVEWQVNRVPGPSYWNNKWRMVGEDVSEYRKPFWAFTEILRKYLVLPEFGKWILRVEACEGVATCVHKEFRIDIPEFDPNITGLTLSSEPGTKAIKASWNSVHESVTRYEIFYSAADGQTGSIFVDATEANVPVPSYGSWEVEVAPCAHGCWPFTDAVEVDVRRAPPDKPTGITLSQDPVGSLSLLVESNTAPRANNYKIRWRKAGPGNELNDGVTVTILNGAALASSAAGPVATFTHPITVSEYGAWIVRVEACNESGCSGAAERIKVERAPPPSIAGFTVADAQKNTHTAIAASWGDTPHTAYYELKWRRSHQEFEPENKAIVPATENSYEIELPIGGGWVVRARACNQDDVCGPAVSQFVNVVTIIQFQPMEVVSGVVLEIDPANLNASSSWDHVSGAEYFKLWYIGYIDGGGTTVYGTTKANSHSVVLPDYGRWELAVHACDEYSCFAAGYHPVQEISPPSSAKE